MKNKLLVFLSLSAILLSGLMRAPILQQPSEARAANSFFDVFIEIDGVQGSSTHVNAMDILSWSFGASNPTSVGSGGDVPTESVSLNFAKIEFSYDLKVAKK